MDDYDVDDNYKNWNQVPWCFEFHEEKWTKRKTKSQGKVKTTAKDWKQLGLII